MIGRPWTDERLAAALAMYRATRVMSKVAEECGISNTNIHQALITAVGREAYLASETGRYPSRAERETMLIEIRKGRYPPLAPIERPPITDDTTIELLDLPTRIWGAMRNADCKTVGDIRRAGYDELMRTPNCGVKILRDLNKIIGVPELPPPRVFKVRHIPTDQLLSEIKRREKDQRRGKRT